MTHYSLLQLAAEALLPSRRGPAFEQSELKSRYDVVIVGGGGHGLATAYYLAKEHKLKLEEEEKQRLLAE